MTWLKVSDNAAFHPVVTAPLTEPVPTAPFDAYDMVHIAFALVVRCATHAASFNSDYIVKDGTVALMAGPNWLARAEMAERAGYWRRDSAVGGWVILDDPENFLHIRLKAEIDWEKQRRRDNSDAALVVPVRLRDGDGCRYCGKIVNWNDRKSARGGTYDHRVPGQPAASPEDLLVACQGCNGFRSNRPDANEARPARPAPVRPFFGAETVAFLGGHGHVVPQTPGTQPGYRPAAARPPAAADDAAPQNTRGSDAASTAGDATTHHGDDQPQSGHPAPTAPPGRRNRDRRAHRNPAPSRANGRITAARPPAVADDAAPRPSAGSSDAAPRPPAGEADATPRAPRRGSEAASTTGVARGPGPYRPRGAPRTPDLPDPADRSHAGSGSPGRDGSGRVSPTPTPYIPIPSRRPRRRPQSPRSEGHRHA